MAANIGLESLVLRKEAFVSQVPFTGKKGSVAMLFQGLCKGELL